MKKLLLVLCLISCLVLLSACVKSGDDNISESQNEQPEEALQSSDASESEPDLKTNISCCEYEGNIISAEYNSNEETTYFTLRLAKTNEELKFKYIYDGTVFKEDMTNRIQFGNVHVFSFLNADEQYDIIPAHIIVDKPSATCFYATIAEISETGGMSVLGFDCNDINYRGLFSLKVEDETEISWRGTQLSLDDLDVGDTVAIYFNGGVLEMYPAQLVNTVAIHLLDDDISENDGTLNWGIDGIEDYIEVEEVEVEEVELTVEPS